MPEALFVADGSLLYTTSKSDLMSILEVEELPRDNAMPELKNVRPAVQADASNNRVAIVDGMSDL